MDQSTQPRVPRFIFALIPVILIAMYCYAAFFDIPESAQTVNKFYTAYFSQDFETVSENLSVFWAVQFLPKYGKLAPTELLNKRDEVMKETTAFIKSMEAKNTPPKDVRIKILKDYTVEGENSAIVAYQFIEKGKMTGMEAAILIREKGKFRIFEMMTVDSTTLQQLKSLDISTLDTNFGKLLNTNTGSTATSK